MPLGPFDIRLLVYESDGIDFLLLVDFIIFAKKWKLSISECHQDEALCLSCIG